MIDRVTAKLGRKLYEVPVGFKWFVDGLLDGSLGFGGEESAGASFLRLDGSVWTTDKDGIVPALLAAEITARMGRDPGEIYRELTREFGEPVYDRVEAPATPDEKRLLAKLSPEQVKLTELAGEKIEAVLTRAPGNGAPIGGLKVVTKSGWFAARPSGTESIYKIYAESFQGADHLRHPRRGGATDRRRCPGDGKGAAAEPRVVRPQYSRRGHHEHTAARRPPDLRTLTQGHRGIRFSRRAGLGPALVVESRDRRGLAPARSRALGVHAQSLGRPADGVARQAPSPYWPTLRFAKTSIR